MVLEQRIIFYLVICLIIPLLFVLRCKNRDAYLNKGNTENIKAIAITVIVIHHFAQQLQNPGILTAFKGFGYLGVSIFFFLSGYGLTYSYTNKTNYLSGFFIKRLGKIYLPFMLVNALTLIVYIFVNNKQFNFLNTLYYILGIRLISPELWYILAIIMWYALFYFCFKYTKNFTAEKLLYLFALVYFVICWRLNFDKAWFDTSFIFPVGVSFFLRKEKIIYVMKKYYLLLLTSNVIMFGLTFMLNYGKTSIQYIVIRAFSAIFFTILINLFLLKIDLSNNRILMFLGAISFEIYLTHYKFLTVLIGVSNKINIIHLVLYFGAIILVSMLLNKVNLLIGNGINAINHKKITKSEINAS